MQIVSSSGEEALYAGRLVKRGAPVAEDWLTIEAHGTISVSIELAQSYLLHDKCVCCFA